MATSRTCVSLLGSAFVLAVVLAAAPTGAATLTVCSTGCDSVTIQGAANAANPGDTIQFLSIGAHTEGEIYLTKNLTIDGSAAGTPVIQAATTAGEATVPVFVVTNGANVTMLDLSVHHGGGSNGGGIMIIDGHVSLEDVQVTVNKATGKGGGIYVALNGSLETNRTIIYGNHAGISGGGVYADGAVEMTDTTVTENIGSKSHGGGIWSAGTLTMRACRLASNHAESPNFTDDSLGGGLYYHGPNLQIEDGLFTLNSASNGTDPRGGGLYLAGSGTATLRRTTILSNAAGDGAGVYSGIATLTLEDCTISNNVADYFGGGVFLEPLATGVVRLLNSTIVGNEARYGGGLYSETTGRVVVANSTISGNTVSGDGGGIFAALTGLEIASSTVTDNTADSDADSNGNGGGIYIVSGESVELRNTIIASNHDSSPYPTPRATDCAGTVQSAGYNLVGSLGSLGLTACNIVDNTTGNLVGANPLLDVLADNGGPTETHALGSASPAIDAANPGGCLDPGGALLAADQRYALRLDRCDMGAFEVGAYFEPFFADGFESGSTNAWSSSVP